MTHEGFIKFQALPSPQFVSSHCFPQTTWWRFSSPPPTTSSLRSHSACYSPQSLSRAHACIPPSCTPLFRHHFLWEARHDSSQPQVASSGFPSIICRTVAVLDSPRQGAGQIQCPPESQAYGREKSSLFPKQTQLCLFPFYVLGFCERICLEKNAHCHKRFGNIVLGC